MIPHPKRVNIKHNDHQTTSVKQTNSLRQSVLDKDMLAEMAADPEIQNEIALINDEFAETEDDGLSDEL